MSVKSLVRNLLPRGIRPHRILSGPLAGCALVTSWHDYPAGISGRTERLLLDWFRDNVKTGDTWLDIGAHYGYTAIALSRLVGPNGRVFTFEPVVASAGCVAQTRKLNGLSQLTVVPLGLGTPQTLATTRLPVTRGMADRTIAVHECRWSETVQVARFDWIWPKISLDNDVIEGVKVDVQGMELEVLLGMEQVLRRHHPKVVVEFHRGVDRQSVLGLLEDVGYRTEAIPIEPQSDCGTEGSQLRDDHSYAFVASSETNVVRGVKAVE